jgi:hypothetical protein
MKTNSEKHKNFIGYVRQYARRVNGAIRYTNNSTTKVSLYTNKSYLRVVFPSYNSNEMILFEGFTPRQNRGKGHQKFLRALAIKAAQTAGYKYVVQFGENVEKLNPKGLPPSTILMRSVFKFKAAPNWSGHKTSERTINPARNNSARLRRNTVVNSILTREASRRAPRRAVSVNGRRSSPISKV